DNVAQAGGIGGGLTWARIKYGTCRAVRDMFNRFSRPESFSMEYGKWQGSSCRNIYGVHFFRDEVAIGAAKTERGDSGSSCFVIAFPFLGRSDRIEYGILKF